MKNFIKLKTLLSLIFVFSSTTAVIAQDLVDQPGAKWTSDNGDGTFTNPVISADFPDPDIIRVGSVCLIIPQKKPADILTSIGSTCSQAFPMRQ